ncbi:MAG TPA: hypothetical protein VF177_11255 [Anaerolineae bacterium]
MPDDPVAAEIGMQGQLGLLRDAQRAIPASSQRLDTFIQRVPVQGVAFGDVWNELPQAERQLAFWLSAGSDAQDFASLKDVREELAQVVAQVSAFSDQVRHTLTRFALVKTTSGEQAFAHTTVAWKGSFHTTWLPGGSFEKALLHQQALRLALATRQIWIRIATLVAASAVRLATLLPSGVGAIVALPAVWNFMREIVGEYQRLQQLKS